MKRPVDTYSEKDLKQIFVTQIEKSFYENADNSGKKFIIDNTNKTAILNCFEWALALNRTKGLMLYGDYGVGKSAIIEGLFRFYCFLHYYDSVHKPIYRTAIKIVSYFREDDVYGINICKTTPMLFIPEIGRESLKVFENKPIEEVISERYDRKLSIVSSCNELFDLPYGDYIVKERIFHMCKVIEMRGDSKR
jgi:DNA replication protein DnaC